MSPRFTKAPPQTGLPETESSVLKGQLTKLGLHSMAATFEAEADRAVKSETSFTAYLGRLVELELADKADRSINARIARARFPVLRTLEQFDFGFQPSLSAARVPRRWPSAGSVNTCSSRSTTSSTRGSPHPETPL